MASPAAKRRKLDKNTAQINQRYNVDLFLNSAANHFLCMKCRMVPKVPYFIGCDDEDLFCKPCLDNYFNPPNSIKQCPECGYQGLFKKDIKPSTSIKRIVISLKLKCPLQSQQNSNNNNDHKCEWIGELGILDQHVNIECPLGNYNCNYCSENMKRYQSKQHDDICVEKPVPCNLCGQEIQRKLMEKHQNNKCGMKTISCVHCKKNLLRKNRGKHIFADCPEYEIECIFRQFGCIGKMKRKLMCKHLEEKEMEHLKMKVNTIVYVVRKNKESHETELKELREDYEGKLKKNKKKLKKMQEEYKGKLQQISKQNKMQCQHLKSMIQSNNKDRLLLLLKSKDAYIYNIELRVKQRVEISSFMNEKHWPFCMGNNIKFSAAKKIGFDAKDIDLIGNDIVFGLSMTKISAVNLNTKICKTFSGNISVDGYTPIYCNNYGLMVVGGTSVNDNTIPNKDIYKIEFNNNKFTQQRVTNKFTYSGTNPSVCMINDNNNDKLFVCGGLWNKNRLRKSYVYSFNDEWKELKSMNHEQVLGGICVWKERGNKIIVAGGWPNIKYVEEYDMHKNKWIDLPNLNEKHAFFPALLTSNNILFCVGGTYNGETDGNLGCIELFDPRDQSNKWIYVDTVQNYFDINQNSGAGHNCFLPL